MECRNPRVAVRAPPSDVFYEGAGCAQVVAEEVLDAPPPASSGVVRSTRDLPPAHYTFQIKNFSFLFKNELVKKCESGQFEVGGYQWRLVVQLHTDGKKNIYCNHGNDHISLYLAIANQNNLLPGWEVNVNFKFFVFDQIRNNYLCVEDGIVRRFDNLKTEWGFAQLLPLDFLGDLSRVQWARPEEAEGGNARSCGSGLTELTERNNRINEMRDLVKRHVLIL